jgi:hypothetical protein
VIRGSSFDCADGKELTVTGKSIILDEVIAQFVTVWVEPLRTEVRN